MAKEQSFENGYKPSEEFPEYIEHFLYFPRSSDAEMAAEQLRARGWSTKVDLGADDRDWLVLATQPAKGDEDLSDVFPEMEDPRGKIQWCIRRLRASGRQRQRFHTIVITRNVSPQHLPALRPCRPRHHMEKISKTRCLVRVAGSGYELGFSRRAYSRFLRLPTIPIRFR